MLRFRGVCCIRCPLKRGSWHTITTLKNFNKTHNSKLFVFLYNKIFYIFYLTKDEQLAVVRFVDGFVQVPTSLSLMVGWANISITATTFAFKQSGTKDISKCIKKVCATYTLVPHKANPKRSEIGLYTYNDFSSRFLQASKMMTIQISGRNQSLLILHSIGIVLIKIGSLMQYH